MKDQLAGERQWYQLGKEWVRIRRFIAHAVGGLGHVVAEEFEAFWVQIRKGRRVLCDGLQRLDVVSSPPSAVWDIGDAEDFGALA